MSGDDRLRSLRGRREVVCRSVVDVLPALAGDDGHVGRRARTHIGTCLCCQAEVARYRRQHRDLRALLTTAADPGPSLPAEVLASLDGCGDLADGRRTAACVGGLSMATVAGAAGAIVWWHRRMALTG